MVLEQQVELVNHQPEMAPQGSQVVERVIMVRQVNQESMVVVLVGEQVLLSMVPIVSHPLLLE